VIASVVYALCAVTSCGCTILLLRRYRSSGFTLLLWSAVCFAGFTVNNVLLFVDLILFPNVDLLIWRNIAAVSGVATLLFALIWDTQ
jgi:hypothetical protein